MPFGPFKDFDACVMHMTKKGHPEATARRMCGRMQKDMEKAPRKIQYGGEFTFEAIQKPDAEVEFLVHGVAINETTTRNRIKYTGEELMKAASSLIGKPILKDHDAKVDNIVGQVINAVYEQGKIPYTGKITDESMKGKIKAGLIKNVSIGAAVSELTQDETEEGVMIAKGIDFMELSLVACPGDKNATITHAIMEAFKDDEDEDFDDYADEKAKMEDVKMEEKIQKELDELRAYKQAAEEAAINSFINEIVAVGGWTREELKDMPLTMLKKLSEKIKVSKPSGKGEVSNDADFQCKHYKLKNGLNVLKIKEGNKVSLTVDANEAYRKKFFPYAN